MIDTTHTFARSGRLRSGDEHADVVRRCPVCTPVQSPTGAARDALLDALEVTLAILNARAVTGFHMLPATEDVDRFVADRGVSVRFR